MDGTDWLTYDKEHCTDGTGLYSPEVPVEDTAPGDPGSGGNGGSGPGGSELPDDGANGPVYDPASRLGGGEPVPAEEVSIKIFLDESLTGTKAECVFNKLQEVSTGFMKAIQKFDGEFPVSHLRFTMEDLGSGVAGKTIPPNDFPDLPNSPDYVITIVLNNDNSKAGVNYRPNLMVAKTLAHEVIHAEMFRKLMSLTQQPNFDLVTRQELIDLLSNGDFSGIYDYYRQYRSWQHQQMAAHYRETIADILQAYDNYSHSRQFYMDLAWEGLIYTDIVAWAQKSGTQKTRIKNVILNYIKNNKYEGCQ